jgi:hypothetical protein
MNSRNWVPKAWVALVVCCLATLIGIALRAPTNNDEGLILIELAGQAASPWPSDATLVSTLKKREFETTVSLPKMIAGLDRYEGHPPLYHVLLRTVTRFIRVGRLFDYRLFSVVLGAATLYLFARWTKSQLCFTLFAFSSLELFFATFARPYMLAVLFVLTTAYLLDPDLHVPDWVRWAAGLCGALAVWTHFFTVFPIVVILMWSLLLYWRDKRLAILGATLLFGALSAPALWLAYTRMHSIQTGSIGNFGGFPGWFPEAGQMMRLFLRNPTDPLFWAHPYKLSGLLDKLAWAIFAFSLLTVIVTFRRRSRRVQLAFLLVISQPIFFVLLSRVAHQAFNSYRYMGLLLPFYYVLIGDALSGSGFFRRSIAALYVALVVMASVMGAAGTLQENRLRKTVLGGAASNGLVIVWSQVPSMPASILNDLPDTMSLYFIQSDESIQKAINWHPAIYRKAFFCPQWNTPHSEMYNTLRSHFSGTAPRIFGGFDCYPWARDNRQ